MSTPDDPTPIDPSVEGPDPDVITPLDASSLSQQDDTFLTDVLRRNASNDPLPADIAARWDAAIVAESQVRTRSAPASASAAAGASTVVPLSQARSSQGSQRSHERQGRGLRFTGIAASIAAIALVGGIVANTVLSSSPTSSNGVTTAQGTSDPEAATLGKRALPLATTVSTSGLPYQPSRIATQLKALLNSTLAPASGQLPRSLAQPTSVPTPQGSPIFLEPTAAATDQPGAVAPDAAGSSPGTATTPDAPPAPVVITPPAQAVQSLNADPMAVTFRTNEQRRADCLTELNSGPGAQPVLMDLGFFNGAPAALVVLPTADDDARLDVWIVGPNCAKGDGHVLWFGRVIRP